MRVYVGGRKRIGRGFSVGAFVPVKVGPFGLFAAAVGGLVGLAFVAAAKFVGAILDFIGGAVAEGRDEYRKIKAERMELPAAVVAVAEKEKAELAELAAKERVAARHKALCEEFFEIK